MSAGLWKNDVMMPGPYVRARADLTLVLRLIPEGRRALDLGHVPGALESHQPLKVREEGDDSPCGVLR